MPAPGEDEREEAKLFYVGATRATQRLIIGLGGKGGSGSGCPSERAFLRNRVHRAGTCEAVHGVSDDSWAFSPGRSEMTVAQTISRSTLK